MDSITLKYEVRKTDDSSSNSGALTFIKAKIFSKDQQIGSIGGIQVNRQHKEEYSFQMTLDDSSGDLQWIGSTLLKNGLALRTKRQSLRDDHEYMELNFFYINEFHIDEEESCDVATYALHKFLHGEHIKGSEEFDCRKNAAFAYVVLSEDVTNNAATGKQKRDDATSTTCHEIIPFLRNGFFQDISYVNGNDLDNARILVAGIEHLEKGLLSEAEAKRKASLLTTETLHGDFSEAVGGGSSVVDCEPEDDEACRESSTGKYAKLSDNEDDLNGFLYALVQ